MAGALQGDLLIEGRGLGASGYEVGSVKGTLEGFDGNLNAATNLL